MKCGGVAHRRGIVLRKLSNAMSERLAPLIPPGVGVAWHVFGSSANTFGMESSDVDVCALWRDGTGQLIPQQLAPAELVRIAALMAEELGMEEVRSVVRWLMCVSPVWERRFRSEIPLVSPSCCLRTPKQGSTWTFVVFRIYWRCVIRPCCERTLGVILVCAPSHSS
jgi:hypothetical protein